MTSLEALIQIAESLEGIRNTLMGISLALWFLLIFKNMGGGD